MSAESPSGRLAVGRRRAARAKLAVAAGGVVAFGLVLVVSRSSYASHPKSRAQPLAAPRTFVDVVRSDILKAGLVAPPTAPPEAQTATS